jgi:pseudouridine 5'-phosphatase
MVFDLDGTLLDSEDAYTLATDQLLQSYGYRFTSGLKKEVVGTASLLMAQRLIECFNLPLDPDGLLQQREPYLLAALEHCREISGAGRFLAKVKEKKIPIAVATSSPRHLFELKLRNHEWRSCLDEVVCGDDHSDVSPKPAPDIFLSAAAQLGVESALCWAFEDSPPGFKAVGATDMALVVIKSEYNLEELDNNVLAIDSYDELQGKVDTWL